MFFKDIGYLCKEKRTLDKNRRPKISYEDEKIYCNVKSIGLTEFYQAQSVGLKPEIKIEARLVNIDGATHFKYNNKLYTVAVGEDGPTHQPVETVSGLRVMPNLDVVRPADEEEAAGAWMCALQRTKGPTALILTRQDVPSLTAAQPDLTAETRRQGTLKGAYIARREATAQPGTIIIATGSEVYLALEAAKQLGDDVRVVSMPSMWRFNRQPAEYREEVLPSACTRRVAIEAGKTDLWYRYVGPQGAIIGIDTFGFSAPGAQVLSDLGMNVENIINTVKSLG